MLRNEQVSDGADEKYLIGKSVIRPAHPSCFYIMTQHALFLKVTRDC